LEESDRVRAACLRFLESYLPLFYPERPDIVESTKRLAAALGGELPAPRMHWKYAWIEGLFGFAAAKRSQAYYNRCKGSLAGSWDRLMFCLERCVSNTHG
jgi:hypothetical protein